LLRALCGIWVDGRVLMAWGIAIAVMTVSLHLDFFAEEKVADFEVARS
jgi:hypothetical protein